MGFQRKCVVIGPETGAKAWEIPAALWRKVGLLQRVRLRRTVSEVVLPVIAELEQLYLQQNLGAEPRIAGRSLAAIEADDVAIEAGLYLFELALGEGLISLGPKGKKVSKEPVGSCGLGLDEAKKVFLRRAVHLILEKSERRDPDIEKHLKGIAIKTAADLKNVRRIALFDPLTVNELHEGLKGNLGGLVAQDKVYLDVLHRCGPIKFLRALRYGLGKRFPEFLKWSPDFITAVAEGLDHGAKITALGAGLLEIENPDAIRAFGRWGIKEVAAKEGEGKRKKVVTRIGQVKELMGPQFKLLLKASPALIDEAGRWSDEEIKSMRNFLPFLGEESIAALAPLPVPMKVGLLDGLWDKLGREFIEGDLALPTGARVIRDIVAELDEMRQRGSNVKDLKALVAGSDLLNHHMGPFLHRKR